MLQEMKLRTDCAPNEISYMRLLRAFDRNNNFKMVIVMFEEMKKEDLVPDVLVFNLIMKGYELDGNYMKVEEMYQEMKRCGIEPNEETACVYDSVVTWKEWNALMEG